MSSDIVINHESCPTLCGPMDHSPPGFSVHGPFQARMLEWVAISFSRGPTRPRDQTRVSWVSCVGRRVLYCWCHLRSHADSFLSELPRRPMSSNMLTLKMFPHLPVINHEWKYTFCSFKFDWCYLLPFLTFKNRKLLYFFHQHHGVLTGTKMFLGLKHQSLMAFCPKRSFFKSLNP